MTWVPSDTELKLTSRYTSRYTPIILTHTHTHIHTHTHAHMHTHTQDRPVPSEAAVYKGLHLW